MAKKDFPLSKVHRLLESGPVVMVTTARGGRPNVMTMSWHTMIDFHPPLVGLVISDRSSTFEILKATRECVINIPTVKMVKQVMACGSASGRTVDKFRATGLTPVAARCVQAPLIDECCANLECTVVDARMATKYNLFVVQVQKAWVDPAKRHPQTLHHLGQGSFMVAGRSIKVASKA